ncbi:KH domain-containing protein [candidate division KSB1 bacterium]|nr:KH domain-containing protein [candidate division KSB1 bacterium]
MKEFLETLAKNLVDTPEEVEVTEITGDGVNIMKLKVAQGEVGLVIGKKGRTAEALRILLSAVGAKGGKKLVLEILE